MYTIARQTMMLLALTAALWLLHLYSRVLPEYAIVGVWVLLSIGLGRVLFLQARMRRRGWLAIYLLEGGVLFERLRGGVLMALVQGAAGGLLAVLLLLAVMRTTDYFIWIALLATALLLPVLGAVLRGRLRAHASALYLDELAWRWASALLGSVLLAVLTWRAFTQNYPDFGAATLDQAVWHMVSLQHARSDIALVLLQMAAAGDGLRLWLGQQLLPTPGASIWQTLGWILLLAQEALFAWSYLLLGRLAFIPGNTHGYKGS